MIAKIQKTGETMSIQAGPNTSSPSKGALSKVRVIDFTRVLAGPFCTAIMGDIGAEIIKIESVNGDDYRHVPPFKDEESAFFLLVNRGKKSVVVNLKSDDGRAIVHDLIRTADVVVENFKPGVAKRLGIDYETCRALRPNIIYSSISGFGQQGALSDRPAYDVIVQAASGLMQSTGFPENSPTLVGEAIVDLVAGLFSAWGISSALYERERTGKGRYLDVSMFDCIFTMLPTSIAQWSYGGHLPKRVGNRHPLSVPFGTFQASDSYFMLAILNNSLFEHFLDVIGKGELRNDPRVQGDKNRSENEPFVRALIEDWASDFTVDEVVTFLSNAKIPCGPIWNIQQAIESDQVKERKLLNKVTHESVGPSLVLEQPVNFVGQPRGQAVAAPLLGQHTVEVLKDICNLSDAQLAALKASGAIRSNN